MGSDTGAGGRKGVYKYYKQHAIVPLSHVWWKEGGGEDAPAASVDLLGVLQRDRCARNDASRVFVDRSVAILACLSLDGEGPLGQHGAHKHK
jgi:hypothetical protein